MSIVSGSRIQRSHVPNSWHNTRRHVISCSSKQQHDSLWTREDDWGLSEDVLEDVDPYFQDDLSSSGYELVATALAVAAIASLLKVLWYLAVVCYTLVATALQYSVVAIALIFVVVILG